MEIRVLCADDLERYRHIASRAFARGEPVEISEEDFLAPGRTRIGVFEKGALQAQYSIADFELFFGESRRPCGGIASVASEPSARGRGHAGALIDRSLEMMRDRGQYVSILWPFDHRFYRRYGWDWVGHERHYTVPLSLIETSPEGEYVEPVFDDFFAALNPVYEAKAKQYHGPLVRSEKRWTHLLKQHGKKQAACYLYRRDGAAEGLAVIRYDEKKDAARANELVALTPRAYRGLMTLFKRHAASVKKFIWSVPMDDILYSLLAHWDVKTQLFPSAMGRIVDVAAALNALSPATELAGTTCVSISDSRADWNDGVWSVTAERGKVEVRRSTGAPVVSLDIAALSQAYWGTPSLVDLRRAGRLDVADEAGFEFLGKVLPPTPVWLADDF